jgi:hypothetical protein
MRNILVSAAVFLLALPAFGDRSAPPGGLAINLPVVAKLRGGGVQYYTSLDVSNNTGNSLVVDFYFDGVDQATQQAIAPVSGHFVSAGSATVMFGRSTASFSDFIHELVAEGLLTSQIEADGVLGSLLVVFEGRTATGTGSAQARFYNHPSGGGSIGVSAAGVEITNDNPLSLVGIARDTRSRPTIPNLYPNIFVNNTGFDHNGNPSPSTAIVTVTAWDNFSASPVGAVLTFDIPPFQTQVLPDLFNLLDIPAQDDTILVYINVTDGTSAIQAFAVEVDQITHDGSATPMTNAEND